MKSYLGMLALQLMAFGCLIWMTGCGFTTRIDWNGKTGIDNQTVTPEFRTGQKGKY